jgi:ATP-dependent Lon protease
MFLGVNQDSKSLVKKMNKEKKCEAFEVETAYAESRAAVEVELYDKKDLTRLLADAQSDSSSEDWGASEQNKRLADLKKIAADCVGPKRMVLMGSERIVRNLDQLALTAPGFAEVIGLFRREALASMKTGTSMRTLPLILVGPPGIGKTYLVEKLAAALTTSFASIPMNLIDDVGEITGHSLSWRATRPGLIATTLLGSITASPLILIDEIEKAPRLGHDDRPSDIWHSIFERQNARSFRDRYYDLPMRADHIVWVATANDIAALPPSVVDRTIIMAIAPPERRDRLKIAAHIYAEFARERSGLRPSLSADALEVIAAHTLSRCT